MDYIKWATEYYIQADELQGAIDKYKQQLESGKVKNRYLINEKIKMLKSLHTEKINTANELREKALNIQIRETTQRKITEETIISFKRNNI